MELVAGLMQKLGFRKDRKSEAQRLSYRDKFLPEQKEKLYRMVEALKAGKDVVICGPSGSGKTVLAEAAATLFEPEMTKRTYVTMQIARHDIPRAVERFQKRGRQTIAVLDEVTFSYIGQADVMYKAIKEQAKSCIAILQLKDEEDLKDDRVKQKLLSLAQEGGHNTIHDLLASAEFTFLPNIIPDEIKIPSGDVLSQARDVKDLAKMLED